MTAERSSTRNRPAYSAARAIEPTSSNDAQVWSGVNGAHPVRHLPSLYNVVLADIEKSASRPDIAQKQMRDDLYGILNEVIIAGGLTPDSVPFDDRGDGFRIVLPIDLLAPTKVVDTFVLSLQAALRRHRRNATAAARIRMRVCFDIGLLQRHWQGWVGAPLVRAARLVDAQPVRQLLIKDADADLSVVVSDLLFESVVCHGYGYLGPDSFRKICVSVKEYQGAAWLLDMSSLPLLSGAA